MKLEQQVCTLEQAKKLKELGILQDSHFSWFGDEKNRLMDNGRDGLAVSGWIFVSNTDPVNNQQADHREDVQIAKPIAAAYTVAELGEMLPDLHSTHRDTFGGHAQREWYGFDWEDQRLPEEGRGLDTEAECRAAMLIQLLESGAETAEKINDRLSRLTLH